MGVNDLASRPAASACEDQRSYIDLQPPLETDELYISSHFADEPLYQFYTAAIIEVLYYHLKNSLFRPTVGVLSCKLFLYRVEKEILNQVLS